MSRYREKIEGQKSALDEQIVGIHRYLKGFDEDRAENRILERQLKVMLELSSIFNERLLLMGG